MASTSRAVTPEQLDLLKSLVAALQEQDYGKAKQILVGQSSLVNGLHDQLPALQDCHVKTLLELNDVSALEQTLDEQQKQLHHSSCSIDRAYILYRLSKYEQVLQLVSNDSNGGSSSSTEMLHAHLRAQSLFHLKQPHAAIQLYETLLTRDEESVTNDQVRAQLVANYLAAQASVATPYCCQSATNDVTQLVDNFESLLATEPDVALNHGILRATESNDLRPLRLALQTMTDENAREHARLALQAAANYWRGSVPRQSKTLPLSSSTALQAVHQHNQTLACEDARQALEQLPPVHMKWTMLQTRIYRYNLACLQLRAKNHDACRATVKEMFAQWFDKSKQLKQQELNVAQSLWWQARLNVLLYYCDETTVVAASENDEEPLASSHDDPTNATSHTNKSLQLLRTTLDKLRALDACAVRDEAILYLMLHMREPLTVNSVPVSLQSRVGMQYTLGAAERNGDWYMAHGEYAQAVERYEQELKDDPNAGVTIRAKLVRALSYVDPDRAIEMWQQVKGEITVHDENVLDQVTGAELERQELPRLKSSKMRTLATSTNDDLNQQSTTPEKDTKKSHDAILRRRSRQRQAHLDKLAAQGLYRVDRPVPPDPERWLPKYERSHNRKRRAKQQQQNQVHRGAQGSGVSEKESQKLDVVARQQARANGDVSGSGGKSTAHLSVSGTGVVSKKSSRKK